MPPQLKSDQRRSIKYVNKDFSEFRRALYTYAKQYFPDQLTDRSENDPTAIFMEAAAYVGDVLSFTADSSLAESFLYTATERINMMRLAQSLGYKAKTVVPSQCEVDMFQLIPSIGSGNNTKPDFRYGLYVESGEIGRAHV